MLDSPTQNYPDKRLEKCVHNNGVPLYIGVLLHKFHCNLGKGYSSFSGGDRFMGFFISGFYCIRREKHKIRKSFDTQCDIRLVCAYELLVDCEQSLFFFAPSVTRVAICVSSVLLDGLQKKERLLIV